MESLHGTEEREETVEDSVQNLKDIIEYGIGSGCSVYALGFSLDREAMLTYIINQMFQSGKRFDAYFDSPLGYTELVHYQLDYNHERKDRNTSSSCKWFKNLGKAPFDLSKFKQVVKGTKNHIELLNTFKPKVVLTASANGNGGRVVDYFDKFIQDPKAIFVVCGWIYPGSPTDILHQAKANEIVEINGKRYIKKCKTVRLHGFSSHGYFEEFSDVINSFPYKKGVILNHADEKEKEDIKLALEQLNEDFSVSVPKLYDAYHLSKTEGVINLSKKKKKETFGSIVVDSEMQSALEEISRNA